MAYALTRDGLEGDNVLHRALFYDMGAGTTSATIIEFKSMHDAKKNSTYLNVQPIAVAWDTNLGGRDFDVRLQKHFLKQAEAKLKTEIGTPRVIARLRKEAQKVKEVLSANQDTQVVVSKRKKPQIEICQSMY